MFHREAYRAVALVGEGAHPTDGVGRPRLRHRRLALRRRALRQRGRRQISELAAAFHVRRHVRRVMLHRLERPYRPAELRPRLEIFHRHVENAARDSQRLRALADRAERQDMPQRIPAAVDLAEKGGLGNDRALEHNLGLAVGRYRIQRRHSHAARAGLQDEQADVRLAVPCSRRRDEQVGRAGIGDVQLHAVYNPAAVRGFAGGGLDAGGVPASAGLGERERCGQPSFGDARQILALLRIRPGALDSRARHNRAGEVRTGQQRRAHLFEQNGELHAGQPFAAVLRREYQPKPAHARHRLPHIGREPARVPLHVADV